MTTSKSLNMSDQRGTSDEELKNTVVGGEGDGRWRGDGGEVTSSHEVG